MHLLKKHAKLGTNMAGTMWIIFSGHGEQSLYVYRQQGHLSQVPKRKGEDSATSSPAWCLGVHDVTGEGGAEAVVVGLPCRSWNSSPPKRNVTHPRRWQGPTKTGISIRILFDCSTSFALVFQIPTHFFWNTLPNSKMTSRLSPFQDVFASFQEPQ